MAIETRDINQFERLTDRPNPPVFDHIIRPHRSMGVNGFSWVIGLTAFAFCLPMIGVIGTFALWGLFPFVLITLLALYHFIMRNYRDGELCEHIRIWEDLIAVRRHNPRKSDQVWHANPYWVDLKMRDTKKLENYVTLRGSDRTIELGSFLSPDERISLYNELHDALRGLNRNA